MCRAAPRTANHKRRTVASGLHGLSGRRGARHPPVSGANLRKRWIQVEKKLWKSRGDHSEGLPSHPVRGRLSSTSLLLGLVLLLAVGPVGAGETPGLSDARDRVTELTEDFHRIEEELGDVQARVEAHGAEVKEVRVVVESHRLAMVSTAVIGFTRSYGTPAALRAEDLSAAVRADALGDAALGADDDAIDRYRASSEDLAILESVLTKELAQQEKIYSEIAALKADLETELADLEDIEAARLEEVRKRAEQALSRGGVFIELDYCPVAGNHSFIDSWGFPRSGGRRHKGVDMLANSGVPLVAPVSGTVAHRSNRVGGRSFHLRGDDGNYYYGTHMSGYGESGWVEAGTVIGYIGDDGNATGIPHVHLEIHPGGKSATNPYPSVAFVCSGAS